LSLISARKFNILRSSSWSHAPGTTTLAQVSFRR